jgi:molybdopterin molybdotransferase
MGTAPAIDLRVGECALIHTGGMLPAGADAVIMLENTQAAPSADARQDNGLLRWAASSYGAPISGSPVSEEIEILRSVPVGENVIRVGEDVNAGQVVIAGGVRLRPPEIGGLMALGITHLRVAKKPRVALISTGDEVVDPKKPPRPGQVRDVNAYALSAMITAHGGEPVLCGIVPDDLAAVKVAAAKALAASDMLLITGGSSASTRDVTAEAIGALGSPGVLVHGINIRPGKPTILGVCDGKCVIGLPGNPVSALVIGYLFMVPVIERLLGLRRAESHGTIVARLTLNVASQAGREDWWPVRLTPPQAKGGDWLAEPIFARSNLIFSLSAADGLLRVPPDVTGLSAGEVAEVQLM